MSCMRARKRLCCGKEHNVMRSAGGLTCQCQWSC